MVDGFTRKELLQMVANQSQTIHQLRTIIEESLNAIDNESPDLAWRKLLLARERFNGED